jgi:hypothetical protein
VLFLCVYTLCETVWKAGSHVLIPWNKCRLSSNAPHCNSHFDSIPNKSHLVLNFETAAVNLVPVRLLHRYMINREESCFKHVFLYWVLRRMRRFLRLVTTKPYKILPQK